MSNLNLLDGEEVLIYTLGSTNVTLTNLRLRLIDKVWGKYRMTSIMLENISSTELYHRSNPLFIILGVISLLLGIQFNQYSNELMFQNHWFILALVLFLIFAFTRKQNILVSSKGGSKLRFNTKGMGKAKTLDFLNQVEDAIQTRNKTLKQ